MKAPILLSDDLRLGAQLRDAWRQVSALKLPPAFHRLPTSVVVSGMGGSTLGAHVIQSVFRDEISIPFEISNDYHLPNHVDKDTLVILSSYSGTTEETLSAARDALRRKARIVVMTNGGDLLALAKKHKLPCLLIDPVENPSNQPRMAIGYMTIGLAGILAKANVLKIDERRINDAAKLVDKQDQGLAIDLARHLQKSFVLLMSAEHLIGAAHVFNNQINENGKQLSTTQIIPELDHHFLEGLSFPTSIKKHLVAVLFQSNHYHPRNQKRIKLTAEILQKNGIRAITVDVIGKNRLQEAWTAIALGASTSITLAKNSKIDAWPVPNVTWLKEQMAKD
ncbi:SIS domain-containing protein [Candidatus Uhrbacteria bacterium]|nr:SIS domain-containing protein [Candidatus Uhrbacteria bacterium]